MMPSFNAISRRYTSENVSSNFFLKSASKVTNWNIVDILKYFYLPYLFNGKLIFIRNGDC